MSSGNSFFRRDRLEKMVVQVCLGDLPVLAVLAMEVAAHAAERI
jgi:hypothetical protein